MFFPKASILVIIFFVLHLVERGVTRSIPTALGLLQGKFDRRKYAKGPGIVYSPYRAKNTCKTPDMMSSEIEKLKGVSTIRLYGCDCDQINVVLNAAKKINARVMLGVWNIEKIDEELDQIIKDVRDDWEHIDTLAIGNELVNNLIVQGADKAKRQQKADDVVAALKKARTKIGATKWKDVPIVAVDTWIAIKDHPVLCENSDYIAANAHTYFDGNVVAENSGKFIQETVAQVLSDIPSCKGKFIRITESGWPSAGRPNNKSLAGLSQQKVAIESIVSLTKGNVIILSAYDESWKDDGPLQIEKFWGIDKIFQDVLNVLD